MGRNSKQTLVAHLSYWFDNKMAQGFWAKVRLLLLVTLVFVVVVGLLAETLKPDNGESFFTMFMYVLGKGSAPKLGDGHWAFVAIMVVTILYCMFFTAILIGLINNALRSKVEELGKGRSDVLEEGHTLILGFNDAAFVLIEELIEADRNQRKPQSLVILGEEDRQVMADAIRKRFGRPLDHPKTRIICRTGSTYNFADLERCAIRQSRVVVVNGSSDFEAVKTILAVSHLLGDDVQKGPFVVAVIHGEENLVESQIAARGDQTGSRLVTLSLNEVLARIMVHTSRQPGLSDVFTEVFNFAGDEFYIVDDDACFPTFYGKSIAEINHYLQMSYAVGVCKGGSEVVVGPPLDTYFNEGDSLIVVKEDDDPLMALKKPDRNVKLEPTPIDQAGAVNVLIIGVEPIIEAMLKEYACYLQEGSKIVVVDREGALASGLSADVERTLADARLELDIREDDASKRKVLDALLDEIKPSSVVLLVNHEAEDADAEDERAIRTLLYLRHYRNNTGLQFNITSEMLQSRNKELVAATEPDDFIISRQFSALLMAQISQKREMVHLFDQLLSSDGFEIYMKPASWYVPIDEPVDLVSVGQAVAERSEVFIGVRQKIDGSYRIADINPSKYVSDMQTLRQYVFGADDMLVVLAEDNSYPVRCVVD